MKRSIIIELFKFRLTLYLFQIDLYIISKVHFRYLHTILFNIEVLSKFAILNHYFLIYEVTHFTKKITLSNDVCVTTLLHLNNHPWPDNCQFFNIEPNQ